MFQERAQNVKKNPPCHDRLLCKLKFIFMTTLHYLICEIDYIQSWNPPALIKGGVEPSKNGVTRGVQNVLLERGNKSEKGG